MYGMFAFVEILNVQNCVNWTGNCIQNMYEMSGFAEIEYPELRKFNGKFCTLYMYGM